MIKTNEAKYSLKTNKLLPFFNNLFSGSNRKQLNSSYYHLTFELFNPIYLK